MDFFNYKNLKKIFYVLAIISLIISIKSRVFAVSVDTSDDNAYNVPDFIYDDYYFLAFRFPNSTDTRWYFVLSDTICTLQFYYDNAFSAYMAQVNSTNNGQIRYHNSGSNLQTLLNSPSNPPPYISNQVRNPFYFSTLPSDVEYICNYDVYNTNTGDLIYGSTVPTTSYPFFDNLTEIENGNPNGVFITLGDYLATDNLYFHLLRVDNTVPNADTSIYYYSDKTFILNKDSSYYRQLLDTDSYYYYIPQYNLDLYPNSSYIYILNNSSEQIQNTFGLPEKDIANGIYDVVQSDTTGVISSTEQQTNIMKQQEQNMQDINNNLNDINNSINNTTVQNTTEEQIDTSLNYSSDNEQLSNIFTGFFSRLSTWLSQFLDYDITQDTTLNIPIPYSNETITLHSNTLYNQLHNTALYPIIYTFYMFIFMSNLVLFYTKVYARLVTGGYLNSLNNPISETGIDKTIL